MTAVAPRADPDAIAERARRFVDEQLIPREEAAERAGGRLPAAEVAAIRAAALEAGLAGGLHAVEHGGQGWSHVAWALVEEQFGRSTNALSWHVPNAYNVWSVASAEQARRWLRPMLRGEAQDAYAVTEANAGSDPSAIATRAEPLAGGGWRIRGEKWFVTSGEVADVVVVVAVAPEGSTLVLVPAGDPGVTVIDDPAFTHSYPHGHPTLSFDVAVGPDALLGPLGAPTSSSARGSRRSGSGSPRAGSVRWSVCWSRAWPGRPGASRAARACGITRAWPSRSPTPRPTPPPGRLLVLEVARLADAGADAKIVHAKASMAKLFVSEAACRCADRAVQAFGGRKYRRDNVAERFLRELRVDRIWEGTSEIQRLIIARSLERRGVAKVLR
jgi:alkylation response protein AidB-like acyl-CoA dehydrogenase